MKSKLSRRDFLKLSSLSLGGMAFAPFKPDSFGFDDSTVVRVATTSVSVHSEPNDENRITGTWYRDELINVYDEVTAEEPKFNPIWYRVWGGYVHRSRLQRVKFLYNKPLTSVPTRQLAQITVPFTQPWRFTKAYGWQPLNQPPNLSTNPPIYYESVHWIEAVEEGPDGEPWYRIYDDLDSNIRYFIKATHLAPIPAEEFTPISPDVPPEGKRIEVNLSTQVLKAFENDKVVFQTKISSGIPGGGGSGPNELSTTTPNGDFYVSSKMPSKHMGSSFFSSSERGNLLADADGYVLPGVPWTCFFTPVGHAFHGTYWHENFGAPMSHGCVNMRTEESKWLFRWTYPVFDLAEGKVEKVGRGTPVKIYYGPA